jgi:hypothetical protein
MTPLTITVPSDNIDTSFCSWTVLDANDSVLGNSSDRNCESPTFDVTTKKITSRKTISIKGVISIEKLLLFDLINFIIY